MHSPSYAMHKTCRLRGKECTHVNEKVQNACNYLPDHWSFNFCVCFFFFFVVCVRVCQNRREWKEKTRGMKKKREKTSKKAWNKVREAGERHLTAVQLYFTTGVSQNRRRKKKEEGGSWCDLSNPERERGRKKKGWMEGGRGGGSGLDRQNAAATFKSVTFAPSLSIPASFTPSWLVHLQTITQQQRRRRRRDPNAETHQGVI